MHVEVADAGCDGVLLVVDVDAIIDDIAGMRHPLAANHELVFRILTEGIGHAAMPAADIHAALADGVQQAGFLFARDAAHGVDGHHHIDRAHEFGIEEAVQRLRQGDIQPGRFQQTGEQMRSLLGIVAVPTTVDDQYIFAHVQPAFRSCLLPWRYYTHNRQLMTVTAGTGDPMGSPYKA